MLKLLNRKNGGGKGFTLIELLVVIAIIGILASIVLASLNTARKKSRDARRIADLNQIRLANELYFDSNSGSYAATIAALAGADSCGTGNKCIAVEPTAPAPGSYTYCIKTVSGSNTSYGIHATLELTGDKPTGSSTSVTCDTAMTCSGASPDVDYCVGP